MIDQFSLVKLSSGDFICRIHQGFENVAIVSLALFLIVFSEAFFNNIADRIPDLATASRAFEGIENQKGGFQFREAEIAVKAAELLGAHVEVGSRLQSRKATLKRHKDGLERPIVLFAACPVRTSAGGAFVPP